VLTCARFSFICATPCSSSSWPVASRINVLSPSAMVSYGCEDAQPSP
jgi:hypothetical protein